jgi:MinD-like ATPase involved in chromosome partitioning or flagellar assembly
VSEPELAVAFTPDPWVERLHRYCSDHGGARVRLLVMDLELLREEQFDILVAGHRWPGLTAGVVAEMHERGRSVVGVVDRAEPAARAAVAALGVEAILESDDEPRAMVGVLASLRGAEPTRARERAGVHHHGSARLVVVGGPPGTGRTEVAVHLAAAWSEGGERALLADVDAHLPSCAQRLGMPVEPGLRDAIDAVEHGRGELGDALQQHERGFDVLTGLPSATGWRAVRPAEISRVFAALREATDVVVVDGFDDPLDERIAGLLPDAAAVVVVAGASPIGIARALRWTAAVGEVVAHARIQVVVNRVPRDAFRRAEIVEEVAAGVPCAGAWTVPFDPQVEQASWRGGVLRRGPFPRAVGELACSIRGVDRTTGERAGGSAR